MMNVGYRNNYNNKDIEKKKEQFFKEMFMVLPESYKTPLFIEKLNQFKLHGKLKQDDKIKKEENELKRQINHENFIYLDVRKKEDFDIFLDAIKFNRETWMRDLQKIEDKIKDDKEWESEICDFYNTNNNFWVESVKKNGTILKIVPKQMITYNMCIDAVSSSWEAIEFVPDTMKNEEICNVTINNYMNSNSSVNVLNFIPKKLITNDMALNVFKKVKNFYLEDKLENYVSEDFLDDNKIKEILKSNPYIFKKIPDSYKFKKEICLYALKCGLPGYELPFDFIIDSSLDLYVKSSLNRDVNSFSNFILEAVKYEPLFLEYIPEKYRTKELYDLLLEEIPSRIYMVPNELLTQEKCINAIKKTSPGTLYCSDLGIPTRFKNYSFYLNYLKKIGELTFYEGHSLNYLNENKCYFEDEIDEFLKLSKNELCAMSFFSSLGTFELDIDKVTVNEFEQAQHQNLDEYYIEDIQLKIDKTSKYFEIYDGKIWKLNLNIKNIVDLYFEMFQYGNKEKIIQDILFKFEEKIAHTIILYMNNNNFIDDNEGLWKEPIGELHEYLLVNKKNDISGRKM